jgi:AraC family transcriptional activator of pyochelin receptor
MDSVPEGTDCGHHILGNGRSVCVTISVRHDYLGKLLGTWDNRLLENAEQTDGDGFFFQRYEMDPASLRAVADMLTMKHRGTLRLIYAKAKSEELLVNALSFACRGERASTRIRLGERDRTRILQVREMLDANFAKPPPVSELALRFGINRNKLSYGFRAVHDRSMSEYIADRRLETAWRLLNETDRPVAHIAEDVGFSHLQSFSSAFKRRYGLSPSMLRRSGANEK